MMVLPVSSIADPVVENGEVTAVRFKVMLKKGNKQQVDLSATPHHLIDGFDFYDR